MITPDANIFLYAYNEDAPQHFAAKKWLEEQLSSAVDFGLSWQVMTAFLRISTNPKAFPQPFNLQEATEIVDEWLTLPNVEILMPTAKHWTIFLKVNQQRTNQSRSNDGRASCRTYNRTRRNTGDDRQRFSKVFRITDNKSAVSINLHAGQVIVADCRSRNRQKNQKSFDR